MAIEGVSLTLCWDYLLAKYVPDFTVKQGQHIVEQHPDLYRNASEMVAEINRDLLPELQQRFDLGEINLGCNYHPDGSCYEGHAFYVGTLPSKSNEPAALSTLFEPLEEYIDLWFKARSARLAATLRPR